MPRSNGSLVLAASSNSRSRENRLTEIYAVALEGHTPFADRVFRLARLEPAAAYEAYVQVALEGAVVLCRSTQSTEPLREVYGQLEFLIKAKEFVRRNGLRNQ